MLEWPYKTFLLVWTFMVHGIWETGELWCGLIIMYNIFHKISKQFCWVLFCYGFIILFDLHTSMNILKVCWMSKLIFVNRINGNDEKENTERLQHIFMMLIKSWIFTLAGLDGDHSGSILAGTIQNIYGFISAGHAHKHWFTWKRMGFSPFHADFFF